MGTRESERESGDRVASSGRRGDMQGGRRWLVRAGVPRPHALYPSSAPRKMTGVASQLGRLVGPELVGRQVRPGTIPFLSFILFLFSIF